MGVPVHIIGTGGHARVVAEILRAQGRRVAAFVHPPGEDAPACGLCAPVRSWQAAREEAGRSEYLVGVGDGARRRELQESAESQGLVFTTAVHPSASVGSGVVLEPGVVVAAQAAIVLDGLIGKGALINTGACVDHDCRIGAWSHVGPGAVLAGSVTLERLVFIGAGAVVINGIRVGAGTVVGAGAAVVRDLPAGVTAVGVPAVVLDRRA